MVGGGQYAKHQEKENFIPSTVDNNGSLSIHNSSIEIDGKLNPNSPTVQGLIAIKGSNATSPTTRTARNFSIKVCNCKETSTSCDHQVVSCVTEDRRLLTSSSRYLNLPSTAATTQSSGINAKRSMEIPSDKSTGAPANIADCSTVSASTSSSSDDCNMENAHARWKYLKLGQEDINNSDMGVSVMNSDQLPRMMPVSCCDDSVINDVDLKQPDFFVYKRRRMDLPTEPNYFDRLQGEIILQIFKWITKAALVNCAQTCRRFHRLALDFSLWRRLDLAGRHMPSGSLGRIVLRGCKYLRLSKAELPGAIFSPGLKYLPTIESNLVYLDLSMAEVSVENLSDIFEVCTKLRKISLEFLAVNEKVFVKVAQNHDLDTLNLSMCKGVNEKCLMLLSSQCKLLSELNLAWTHLSYSCLTNVLPVLPRRLTKLNLSGSRSNMRDGHVRSICQRLTQLTELDVSDCTELTRVSVEVISSNLFQMRTLYFSRCYSIHFDIYQTLHRLYHLKNLLLHGLSGESILGLMGKLPGVAINRQFYSTVARPTVGLRRTSIWLQRVRDF